MLRFKPFFVALTLGLSLIGFCQDTGPTQKAYDFEAKVKKLDILNQLLPVLLTKKQITALLPVLEKARAEVRKTRKQEEALMVDQESKVTKALEEGITLQKIPTRQLLSDVNRMYAAIDIFRKMKGEENTQSVLEVFEKVVNAGQRKVAAQSLNIAFFDKDAQVDKMSEHDKEAVFVREILLHPYTYELLVKIAAAQKD